MRRTLVTFEVHGSDHKDLVEQARIRYAEYVGQPDAPLPPQATMEVSSEAVSGDGKITLWTGEVSVSITA